MNSTFNILQNGGSSRSDRENQLTITRLVTRHSQLGRWVRENAKTISGERERLRWANNHMKNINNTYRLLRQFYLRGSDGENSTYVKFIRYLAKGIGPEAAHLLRSNKAGGVSVVADLETLIQLVKRYQFDVTGSFVTSAKSWLAKKKGVRAKRELSKLEANLARTDADMKKARGDASWPRGGGALHSHQRNQSRQHCASAVAENLDTRACVINVIGTSDQGNRSEDLEQQLRRPVFPEGRSENPRALSVVPPYQVEQPKLPR